MFRAIFEQPDALRDTLRGRVDPSQGVLLEYEIGPIEIFRPMKHVVLVGCGTSRHAGLVGKFLIEHFARVQVDVDYASEFRNRDPLLGMDTLFVAINGSGKTTDTLEAMHWAREKGAFVLLICDTKNTEVARLADSALCTRAGPEIGVGSTKTFITQLAAFYLLGLFLASARNAMAPEQIRTRLHLLNRVPEQIERVLDSGPAIEALAERFCEYPHVMVLGHGVNFPIALEGASKLNQIAGIHAEAYPSSEHSPLSVAGKATPLIALAPQDNIYRKTLSDIRELSKGERLVLAVASDGDGEIAGIADYVVRIPEAEAWSNPFLTVVPLQLFAYYAALLRGIEV